MVCLRGLELVFLSLVGLGGGGVMLVGYEDVVFRVERGRCRGADAEGGCMMGVARRKIT